MNSRMLMILSLLPGVLTLSGFAQEVELRAVNRDLIIGKDDGRYYEYGRGQPFTGTAVLFHESGRKQLVETFKEGQLHGPASLWHENGKLAHVRHYRLGRLNGLETQYNENGRKEAETTWQDGKRHGLRREWYENGQIRSEEALVNGYRHGVFKSWHDNGQQRNEIHYRNGVEHGPWPVWDEEGNPVSRTVYFYGGIEGETEPGETDLVELDLRTRCLALLRELLSSLENGDLEAIMARVMDNGHSNVFKVYPRGNPADYLHKMGNLDPKEFIAEAFEGHERVLEAFGEVRCSEAVVQEGMAQVKSKFDRAAEVLSGDLVTMRITIPSLKNSELNRPSGSDRVRRLSRLRFVRLEGELF